MFTRIATAAAFSLAAFAAQAETISLDGEMKALSLHSGGIHMAVYYMDRTDHFEVIATYAPVADPAYSQRLRMGLTDGDTVTFALPDLTQVGYRFARDGDVVTVETSVKQEDIAMIGE